MAILKLYLAILRLISELNHHGNLSMGLELVIANDDHVDGIYDD